MIKSSTKKLKDSILTYINQRRDIPNQYPFIMHEDEKELLKKYIKNTQNYLEFGLGGSTIFTLLNSKAKIISVDTNESWIASMMKYKIIRKNIPSRLEILFVNIGETKFWGYPVSNEKKHTFERFSKEVYEKYPDNLYDFVLVDGRFRVACVLQTIISQINNKKIIIAVHDYSFRKEYQIIEQFLEIKEKANSLYIFEMKENIDIDLVNKLYDEYKEIAD
ncbi:hypothetical protein [uncultured Weeksella sp.]|uniref:hypothetical protein n=1 Tax=uncultured Weeksella sp. TaxID=1161389 RepID=UPI00259B4354|nr:hypothetical protein [uncultured Weeksella sp.]